MQTCDHWALPVSHFGISFKIRVQAPDLFGMKQLFVLILGALLTPLAANAGDNQLVTYQGRILNPQGNPISGFVSFRFTIKSPDNCVLWSENKVVDMTGSEGVITHGIGAGINTSSGLHSFGKIFDNSATLTGLTGCDLGSTYTPGINDDRSLEVDFDAGSGFENIVPLTIKSVPFAQSSRNTMALRGKSLSTAAPANGQILGFNSVTDQWEPITAPASGGGGTLTQVALSLPSLFNMVNGAVSGTSGTLSAQLANQNGNLIFASPDGSSGTPTFRALQPSDLPDFSASKINSGTLSASRGGTGLVPALTDANKVYGVNAAGSGTEFKSITAGSNVTIDTSSPGVIQISAGSVAVSTCTRRTNSGNAATMSVSCLAGEELRGGGCSNSGGRRLESSYPTSMTAWRCDFDGSANSTAFAICCN